MLSGLAEAVEALDLPLHGEAIAEAMRLRDRLDAKLAVAVGEYDAQGLFAVDGAVSMTGWLKSDTSPDGPRSSNPTAPTTSPRPTAEPGPPTHPASPDQ